MPRPNRREFLKATAAGLVLARLPAPLPAATGGNPEFGFDPSANIIPAPDDPARWPEFRRQLALWRESKKAELAYSDALYRRPDFAWVGRNFSCGFVMLCDETFFDPRAGRYRVSEFLEREAEEFGGYDSVVLWHAYPRIGLDDRNQFDFYRDLPGGLRALRAAVEEFHRRDVRVFIDYNPWDTGTRREGKPDVDALCELVGAIAADGIFLDTMDRGAAEFRARLDAVRPGVALEGEIALPLDRVHDHHLSWAQWFADSRVPGVLRNKWFERRHLQHQIKRWDLDHTGELHAAWMNGSGLMVWENVFGSWVGWCERDKSIVRAMLPIQRRYAAAFCGERWTPLVPAAAPDVYASLWAAEGLRLWTLVNRAERPVDGEVLRIDLAPGEQLYDLIAGTRLGRGPAKATLPPRGVGCLLAGDPAALGADFPQFLRSQARCSERANWTLDRVRPVTRLVPAPRAPVRGGPPPGMVEIPAATVSLRIEVRERECGFYESVPPPNHALAASYEFRLRRFDRQVKLGRFFADTVPVTNSAFATFLKRSGYRPRDGVNFLKHWRDGEPPPGKEDHPAVYVDLADARAYAAWAGKRLPSEEEWQYMAQGPAGLRYPWGNEFLPGRCNDGATGGTTPVKQFPDGRSPFGLYDLCGNVWELTESERSDGRTRFCMLKGGAFYEAKGSGWYMNGGPRPNAFSAKMLLMWPSLDRCASVGFRCVADAD